MGQRQTLLAGAARRNEARSRNSDIRSSDHSRSIPQQVSQQAGGHRELRQRQAGMRDLPHLQADSLDLGLARRRPGLHRGGAGA
jgi:hypothetical protein